MAKEFYDWVKLALDNKWLVMLCFTGLSSVATNAAQFFVAQEEKVLKTAMTEQITIMAETYVKPQAVKSTKVTIKQDCNKCGGYFNKIIENHEERLH